MNSLFITENAEDKAAYKKMMAQTVEAICNAFDSSAAYSGPEPYELKQKIHLDSILPENGLGWEKVLSLTEEKILPNMLRTPSSDYMPHLHGPAVLESLAAEAVISAYNQSMDSWDQSPAATEIELAVIRCLCDLYNFGQHSDGVFTSGGTQSNQTAILLARDWYCTEKLKVDIRKCGLPENFKKLRLYTSEISHFSIEKAAQMFGLGSDAVVKIPVDEKRRMSVPALRAHIEQDVSVGNLPFLVVGTVGTTDFGSIDPLEEIAGLCAQYGMWFHADAAYGSGVILSETYKARVSALELCDSITVDFHKLFLLPISCSAVLVKDSRDFDALTIHADYLNRVEDEEDGYTNLVDKSLQTTRRFDALKVWMSFLCRGKSGWSEIITKSMENASYLYQLLLQKRCFYVVTEPEISSVVFRFVSGSENDDEINRRIRRTLLHGYGIVIGQTVADGHVCLKFTLLNPLMTHEKLENLVSIIQDEGKKLA